MDAAANPLPRHCDFRTLVEKAAFIGRVLTAYVPTGGSVLDVGCRERHLEGRLAASMQYIGADIAGSPDVFIDLEVGLPFKDRSCDAVIALDVLEHLNHVHTAARELCRVSRDVVVIALPNMYEYMNRAFVLTGQLQTGKYGLPVVNPPDRHRWFFSYLEAQTFCRHLAAEQHFRIEAEYAHYPAWRRFPVRQISWLARSLALRPNLFARSYWCVLRRTT